MEMFFTHERLDDFLIIEEKLKQKGILLDPQDIHSDHSTRLINYSIEPNKKFKCLLDRNVVSYLISLVNGLDLSSVKEAGCYREVAGLQAFLSAANIESEACMAYHEYIDVNGIDKADNELASFRTADNLNANIYLDIALGKLNVISSSDLSVFEKGELLGAQLPERLALFEKNIVIVKKALTLKEQGLTNYQTMLELVDWLYSDYFFSAPAFHFLSLYFSTEKVSGMIKSKSLKEVRNATWDITYLQQLAKVCQHDDEIWLFSTFDKAIKKTADLLFVRYDELEDDYFNRLEQSYSTMWGKKNGYGRKLLSKLAQFAERGDNPDRKVNIHKGSADYQLNISPLCHPLEKVVFTNLCHFSKLVKTGMTYDNSIRFSRSSKSTSRR
ncbi:hypothetical protein A9Q74_15895 [Colwellia sp. 39_35_sub15_T18]|nr:hypothetical protein A9Q74_15895 [Colwellia sp. 39_35_sub15_T18]